MGEERDMGTRSIRTTMKALLVAVLLFVPCAGYALQGVDTNLLEIVPYNTPNYPHLKSVPGWCRNEPNTAYWCVDTNAVFRVMTSGEKAILDIQVKFRVELPSGNNMWRAMTGGESNAVVQAEADAAAQALTDWQNSKTNVIVGGQQIIVLAGDRVQEDLDATVVVLKTEEILPGGVDPQVSNVTEELVISYVSQMTNAEERLRLGEQLLDSMARLEKVTDNNIGSPPDGSTILSNVE